MPKFYIKHLTKYSYGNPVIDGANQIRLYPINTEFHKILSHHITVSNNPKIETYTDVFNNTVGTFMVTEPHRFLAIESEIEVHTTDIKYPNDDVAIDKQWQHLNNLKINPQYIDSLKYITFDGTEEISEFLNLKAFKKQTPYVLLLDLCAYIYNNFKYLQGITNVDSKLDDVWRLKAGVCQDFTNILLQMIRMAGIPARYVSGYICPNDEGSRGEGATHAWIEAYIPFYGWLGFDPTNNIIANAYHVKLAVGRSYKDCAPVKGVFKGEADNDNLFVKVKVSSIKKQNESFVFPNVITETNKDDNSFRKNLKLIQQQQQQQQQ